MQIILLPCAKVKVDFSVTINGRKALYCCALYCSLLKTQHHQQGLRRHAGCDPAMLSPPIRWSWVTFRFDLLGVLFYGSSFWRGTFLAALKLYLPPALAIHPLFSRPY